jgi:putative transcriptional regulator
MTIHHHPDDATVLAYAAGTVPEGFSLVLAAHFELCRSCRERVAEGQALGGELLQSMAPAAPPGGGLTEVWRLIDEVPPEPSPAPSAAAGAQPPKGGGLPGVLGPYLSQGLDGVAWRSLVPGVRQYVLEGVDSGNGSVRLLAIAPGTTIPHHTHGGGELTLVLRGSYTDEVGRFQSGDLADLDSSVNHQPVADTHETCVCLIATDERLRFSGVFSRMLQPLIGI